MPGSAPQRDSNLPSGNGTPQVLARTTSSGPCQRDFTIFLVRSEVVPKVNNVNDIGAPTTNRRTLIDKRYFVRCAHLPSVFA